MSKKSNFNDTVKFISALFTGNQDSLHYSAEIFKEYAQILIKPTTTTALFSYTAGAMVGKAPVAVATHDVICHHFTARSASKTSR